MKKWVRDLGSTGEQCPISYEFLNYLGNMLDLQASLETRKINASINRHNEKIANGTIHESFTFSCSFSFCEKILRKRELKFCGRCRLVGYCSKECQTKDWLKHRPNCK